MRSLVAIAFILAGCAAETTGRDTLGPSGGSQPGVSGGAGSGSVGDGFGNSAGGAAPMLQPLPNDEVAGPMNGVGCGQDVDLVFVIDVSGSMIAPLTTLAEEVGLVDAALQQKGLPSPPRYGLVIFVDDVVVLNGGQPYADINAVIAAINDEIAYTNINLMRQADRGIVEMNASWPENSLDALHAAATAFPWRPAQDTLRTIIHFTDASFWDGVQVSSAAGDPQTLEPAGGCSATFIAQPQNCTMVSSANSYMATLDVLRDASIWVNTFTALTGGPPPTGFANGPASHGPYRGEAVDVSIGFAKPYNGMNSIAEYTGGLSWNIDDVFDGVISLASPIVDVITDRQCMEYPPPPPLPPVE